MPRTGRRPKLTPDLQARLCNALRAGNFIEAACAAYGIDQSTFHRWMQKGEDTRDPETGEVVTRAKPIYRDFRKAIEEATAVPEVLLVSKTYQQAMGAPVRCPAEHVIRCACGQVHRRVCGHEVQQAGDGDSRSREFLLSRKFPDRWGAKDRHEHTGPGGGPIQHTVKTVRFGGRYEKGGALRERSGDPSPERAAATSQSIPDASA